MNERLIAGITEGLYFRMFQKGTKYSSKEHGRSFLEAVVKRPFLLVHSGLSGQCQQVGFPFARNFSAGSRMDNQTL